MRLNVMLSDEEENFAIWLKKGPYETDRLRVASFKVYGDGALGSRGACLIHDYTDQPGWKGFLLRSIAHFAMAGDQVVARKQHELLSVPLRVVGRRSDRIVDCVRDERSADRAASAHVVDLHRRGPQRQHPEPMPTGVAVEIDQYVQPKAVHQLRCISSNQTLLTSQVRLATAACLLPARS